MTNQIAVFKLMIAQLLKAGNWCWLRWPRYANDRMEGAFLVRYVIQGRHGGVREGVRCPEVAKHIKTLSASILAEICERCSSRSAVA